MASPPDQAEAPYLGALRAYADRDPRRLHVPGHKGGPGADPALLESIGERALAMDIPALTQGIDIGPEPTPFQQAQALTADAWGAARSWFLTGGASQGNHVALLALAHAGDRVVVQRNAHSSTVDGCILAGLTPRSSRRRSTPSLAWRTASHPRRSTGRSARRRESSERRRSRRRTSAPWQTSRGSRRSPTHTPCRWS